jgi:hypothetical protein
MTIRPLFICVLLAVALTTVVNGQPKTRLRTETVTAFEGYVEELEASLRRRLGGTQFLSDSGSSGWEATVRNGAIEPQFTERSLKVPGGLIQDWTATMFVPGVSGPEVIDLLTDYDRHASLYEEVAAGEVLSRDGNTVRSRLRLRKHKVITVVLDTEHEIEIIDAGDNRWQLRSHSTRINEVRKADTPDEQRLPEGVDSGFLWRMNAYWNIEEIDDGVYVECRTATLTRGVPFGLGWIINRFTLAVPRDSLIATLTATRNELTRQAD